MTENEGRQMAGAMKKVLVISVHDLETDRRACRQMALLKDDYEVHTAGFSSAKIDGVVFHKISPVYKNAGLFGKAVIALLLLLRLYPPAYRRMYEYAELKRTLSRIGFDLIIVHSVKPFPIVYDIASNPNVLFDAHEYFLDEDAGFLRTLFFAGINKYLFLRYFRKARACITVGQRIADKYHDETGVRFEVITNAGDYHELEPHPVAPCRIRMIHHGRADSNRKIHLMIELMDLLDGRFELDLMMTAHKFETKYLERLEGLAGKNGRVRVLPPVEPGRLIAFANQYDVGLYYFPPLCFNFDNALPRKFFEFIQSRLMIAIGPSREMGDVVRNFDLGVVAERFSLQAMAAALNGLTNDEIGYYKQQSHLHAWELSSTSQMDKLDALVRHAIGDEPEVKGGRLAAGRE